MNEIYQPDVPDRFNDEAIAKLSPSDPARTLVGLHESIAPLAQTIEDARAKIDADTTLSPQGKLLAKQEVFGKTVAETIQAHSQPLRLAALRVGEQSAALLKSAVAKSTVSEGRMLALASWLRDVPADARGRIVLAAIDDSDAETMAAILSAPAIWNIATPLQREKAAAALAQRHDPEKAAVLADMRVLIQAIHESHESLGRYGRDKLCLKVLPAKAA
jgi:hypothetical protein